MNWVKQLLFLGGIILTFQGSAQNEIKISADLDLFSRHYWRGTQMGTAPAIEPGITFGVKGFSLNLWAAQTFDNSYSEIDLIPSWSAGNYTITLFNYYNPVTREKNNYFDFSSENSRHSLELAFDYNGRGKLPFTFFSGTFIAGDKNHKTQKASFSTYNEFSIPFQIKKIKSGFHFGITPFGGYYAARPAVVSTGLNISRAFVLSNLVEIPLKISVLLNPHTSNAFVIFGARLSIN